VCGQVVVKRYRWLILAMVLIGGAVAVEYAAHRRVVPAGRGETLGAFLAWRPRVGAFVVVEDDGTRGGEHLLAYGPRNSILLLSSGPSAYVFDRAGKLVDWSPDIGDDPVFSQRWGAQQAGRIRQVLTRAEAAAWANAGAANPASAAAATATGPATRAAGGE
jgi:hypothetical protein